MQKLLIDWTCSTARRRSRAYADRLESLPISIARRDLDQRRHPLCHPAVRPQRLRADAQVLDISGDGSNNDGGLVTDMRYEALKERIVINGLPIMNDRPQPVRLPNETDLDRYYLHCVTGGPRSFVEVARNFEDFPPRRPQEAPAGGRRPRPAFRFRHWSSAARQRSPARPERAAEARARGRRLHQVRQARIRAGLRCRRAAQP